MNGKQGRVRKIEEWGSKARKADAPRFRSSDNASAIAEQDDRCRKCGEPETGGGICGCHSQCSLCGCESGVFA